MWLEMELSLAVPCTASGIVWDLGGGGQEWLNSKGGSTAVLSFFRRRLL